MSKPLYPCLWFDGHAKEAANFYCGIFKNSRITYDSPLVVKFELNGNEFMGGSEIQCGWLKDRYGLSWQIVPVILGKLMSDPKKTERVMQIINKTIKFNIKELESV